MKYYMKALEEVSRKLSNSPRPLALPSKLPAIGSTRTSHRTNVKYHISDMGPSNDHELEIAREVDKHSARNDLGLDMVPGILAFLDLKVSSTDYEFLKRYMQWRIDNPSAVTSYVSFSASLAAFASP